TMEFCGGNMEINSAWVIFFEGFKSFLNNILSFVKEIFGFANIMLMRRLENKFGRNIHIISH
ncbi:hypothetical protein, partial [uncultured Duncaniella sp.]|uniref:hypothetical protein n=1 Tax=uncultured Duncaniella sp. TaxID=2768039 RepID=UPI00261005D8